jgi:O-antigen/teichoic acid export membrane protein
MYRFVNLLAIVLMTGLMASTVQAAEVSADDAEESFNIMGYAILGFALIGWTFFLGLLGGAILHILKKARKPYTPKNPVKCK